MRSLLAGAFITCIAVLAIAFYYDYPAIWHLLPQGSHAWHQADCMAMIQNYQQFKLAFLQPAMYNLQSVDGKAAGEFPAFYYIAAQFKNAAFVLRLIHTVIFLSGIIAAYFIAFYFLQRRLLAVYVSILLFTSPLLVFYGNNFLSDVPALSFAFIGWAILFYKKENPAWLTVACLLFAWASLLSINQAINFAIAFIFIWKSSSAKFMYFILFITFLIPAVWYLYATHYNQQHHDHYYLLNILPVWKLSFYEVGLGAWRMCVSWSNNYFWRPTLIMLLLASFFLVKNRRKLNKDLKNMICISLVFIVLYVVLLYQKMIAHEYYYSVFFIFFLFWIIGILKTYNHFHAENVFAHTALFLLLIVNIIFCKYFVEEQLSYSPYNKHYLSADFHKTMLDLGIHEEKNVVSLPDISPNRSLFLLKRKGYTGYNKYMEILKNKQADFLVLRNPDWKQHKELQPYLNDSIGHFKEITFYKLK